MERITKILDQALPWIVLGIFILFTLVIISYIYGIFKARKVDPSLRLSMNQLGKVVFGALYGIYFFLLVATIINEVQIITSTEIPSDQKLMLALNGINALTIVTFLVAIEFQDIFFIGDKNIFIGNRMYEIRRMRKMGFPKKHTMVFVYGQKEYNYSTRFVELQTLKSKFTRMR